jgi:hypothetical protein
MLGLGDIKSDKDFAILHHDPPSVGEAQLGNPSNPGFSNCTKGRAASSRSGDITSNITCQNRSASQCPSRFMT